MNTFFKRLPVVVFPALWRTSALLVGALLLTGCEAPLVLEGVESSKAKTTLRFDQFQSVAHLEDSVVVVGSQGAVVVSNNAGADWQRQSLEGSPALINVVACGGSSFAALDINRKVWLGDAQGKQWQSRELPTQETPLTLTCSPSGDLWVAGSFSTIWSSSDQGDNWKETSLNEDLMFTNIQFLNDDVAYAMGEFGTVVMTRDRGQNWEFLEPLPNEFYPQAALFVSEKEGWVAGLNGAILYTTDGAQSWQRAVTPTDAPIYGLTAGDQVIYAVGDHGTVLFSLDGVNWNKSPVNTKTLAYLRGITALSADQVVLAGGGGLIARINPRSLKTAQLDSLGGSQ